MNKAYKFRIYPTPEQTVLIAKTIGCCRWVYNNGLDARIQQYKDTGTSMSKYDTIKRLPLLKQDHEWLKEVDSIALQASLENLDAAYQNFFRSCKKGRKVGFPRFKSKHHSSASYKTKTNIQVVEDAVKLPKLGVVKAVISTQVQGRILSATVSQSRSGKHFVSLCCTDVEIQHLPQTGAVVGIDLGIHDLVITSDGSKYNNPHTYVRNQEKLAKLQRQLSRKTKGSKRRDKARIKVARLQEHIANQRKDTIHKMTTTLVREYDVICAEDLNASGMVKNHKLAKHISDAAFGEIVRQLKYKCEWYGKQFVQIDPFCPSSQLCSNCGTQWPGTKDLAVREWICPVCGVHHDRDINAATNILKEGIRKHNLVA
jgi:putative transposase